MQKWYSGEDIVQSINNENRKIMNCDMWVLKHEKKGT